MDWSDRCQWVSSACIMYSRKELTSSRGAISSTSAGLLTYHPHASTSSASSQSRSLSAPVTCLASSSNTTRTFAAAGNGMELSLWDIERTFAAASGGESQMNGKRKKELEEGETWRAKNVSTQRRPQASKNPTTGRKWTNADMLS